MSKNLSSAIAILLAAAGPASAHAFLDHASPAVGSTMHDPPRVVQVWFTESIEPTFSTLKVRDTGGQAVDKGDMQRDPTNHSLLRVSLTPLHPGNYKVIWRVVSADTHVTNGDFNFTVAP